ncbi:MAG: signal peptidase II [Opitutaceae bacterium]|nr:signal peptidase II [Verrucomicrobiales bacterium]
MKLSINQRMALTAVVIAVLDQATKFWVLQHLPRYEEKVVIDGFFKFVHWGNTGAAWSMFSGQNTGLAIVSAVALVGLFLFRHHFDTRTWVGQLSLGLIFGGIMGNLVDRIYRDHVVDFIRFYLHRRSGEEIGFPAFNIADSAICVGVGLMFLISWRNEMGDQRAPTES